MADLNGLIESLRVRADWKRQVAILNNPLLKYTGTLPETGEGIEMIYEKFRGEYK